MNLSRADNLPDDAEGDPRGPRRFSAQGREWVVVIAGESTGGTGFCPPARLIALHFAPAEAPDSPLVETLTSRRRLDELYDEELIELLGRGRPLGVREAPRAAPAAEPREPS